MVWVQAAFLMVEGRLEQEAFLELAERLVVLLVLAEQVKGMVSLEGDRLVALLVLVVRRA